MTIRTHPAIDQRIGSRGPTARKPRRTGAGYSGGLAGSTS
jgi:hypothetical protein